MGLNTKSDLTFRKKGFILIKGCGDGEGRKEIRIQQITQTIAERPGAKESSEY